MSHVLSLVALFGLLLCMLPSHRTMAQQLSESGVVYEAARNKLGLIRYCRRNNLLDPTLADQVVTAVETGLRERPPGNAFATEQGDIAQQAGEDGFWDAGRRRDIDGVATLFGTTPRDLCREWADETLRAQAPRPYREVKTITVVPFVQPFQPLFPQTGPAPLEPALVESVPVLLIPVEPERAEATRVAPKPAEPEQTERPPVREIALVRPARPAPPPAVSVPPLPVRAPFLPAEPDLASLQRTPPTGANPASGGRAVLGPLKSAAVMTPTAMSWAKSAPLSAPPATEAAAPLPRDQADTEAAPPPRLDDRPPAPKAKWPHRLGKIERCLMPGCRWPTPQERRAWRY